MTLNLLIITLFAFASVWAQDQSPCAGLIQQGIYDYYSTSSSSSGYGQFVSKFCGAYQQYSNNQASSSSSASSSSLSASDHSDASDDGGSFSLFGLFSIGANVGGSQSNSDASGSADSSSQAVSSGQIAAMGQLLCNGSTSNQAASDALQNASEFIDPNAIAAYEQCLTQTAAGLQVQTNVRDDQSQVTISITYVPPPGTAPHTIIDDIEISPAGSWSCSGMLWNLSQGEYNHTLGTNVASMSCTRNVSDVVFSYLGESLYAVESSIVIITSSADAITRNFVPIYASPPEDIISTLTQDIDQLQTLISSQTQEIAELQSNLTSQANSQAQEVAELQSDLTSQANSQAQEVADLQSSLTSQANSQAQETAALQSSLTTQANEIANLTYFDSDNIAESCYGFSLSGTQLSANCQQTNQAYINSYIDIDVCVGVYNGNFVCGGDDDTDYDSSGTDFELNDTVLSGSLQNNAGSYVSSSIDLSTVLINSNGYLTCECKPFSL